MAIPLPVSVDGLARLGLREPDAAAWEIAELAEAIFGPFDPEVAAAWAAAGERDLGPADLRALLTEAAAAHDPLELLAPIPEARALLERRMRWRWSSGRARALGHPTSLQGRTWASLSQAARAEVREGLGDLAAYQGAQVRRHRPRRGDLDTFLVELARIYARHAARPVEPLAVPHSPQSRFIRLAGAVLEGLPRTADGAARVHPGLRTIRGLSSRWERWTAHATGRGEEDTDEPEG